LILEKFTWGFWSVGDLKLHQDSIPVFILKKELELLIKSINKLIKIFGANLEFNKLVLQATKCL